MGVLNVAVHKQTNDGVLTFDVLVLPVTIVVCLDGHNVITLVIFHLQSADLVTIHSHSDPGDRVVVIYRCAFDFPVSV